MVDMTVCRLEMSTGRRNPSTRFKTTQCAVVATLGSQDRARNVGGTPAPPPGPGGPGLRGRV